MAEDYGTLVTRISNDLNRGTTHLPRIRRAVIDSIRFYRANRLGWNQKRSQAAIDPGDEFVALPTDWIEVDRLILGDGNNQDVLSEVAYDWIDDQLHDRTRRGRPEKFAIENRQLRLYPPADKSYSLEMAFLYRLDNVSLSASDGATNGWVDEGEELIRKHAMAELMITYIRGEAIQEGLLIKQDVVNNVLPALEAQAAREQSSGKIRPHL